MKKLFFTMLALLICFSAFGQGNLRFDYDNSGNCIQKYRTVVLPSPAKPNAESDEETQPQTDILGNLKVTVFPNPTEGLLKVIIDGASEQNFRFTLIDINGKVLQNFVSQTIENEINLTAYTAGIYILQMVADNKRSVFQIIKK